MRLACEPKSKIDTNLLAAADFRVRFLSDDGVAEDGVDGGGLFKEFLTLLLRELMNMDRQAAADHSAAAPLLPLTPRAGATSPRRLPTSSGPTRRQFKSTDRTYFATLDV